MEIIVGKNAGFCFGVENAVKKTEEELRNSKKVCCLGEVVHNKQLVDELKSKGLTIINEEDIINQAGKRLIIRAHGATKEIYEKAKEMDIKIIDVTCPKVLAIHKIAEEYAKKRYYIILVGQPDHPEIIGTSSYCGEHYTIINDMDDVDVQNKNILIIAQTTFNKEKFNEIVNKINEKLGDKNNIEVINTICNATKVRQEETIEISKKVDLMIIVGGKKSSNTNKLHEIACKYCKNSILVETEKELDIAQIKGFNKIGIMAGASTPKKSIDKVVELLQNIC